MAASSSPARQRGPKAQENGNAFTQHAEQDTALNPPDQEVADGEGMSFRAKTLVFLGFPLLAGVAGLYVGYLRTINSPETKIDFDTDFVFPFLLALALVVVLGFQTKGFTKKMTPLIQWPKVRRKKRIIRKRIIVDDNGNEIKDEKEE